MSDPDHDEDGSGTNIVRQAEHTLISASLDVETLDENLFRSPTRFLWVPSNARGVFGGQVISQALVAVTKTVPSDLHCHSFHCYFLLGADANVPVLYYVDRVREGRSFVTRGCKAVQRGKTVFVMMASYSKIEVGQLEAQWPKFDVRSPMDCPEHFDVLHKMLQREKDPRRKEIIEMWKQDRIRSPIDVRVASHGTVSLPAMYWMRARSIPKYDASFQKCILAYMSDLNFLSTIRKPFRTAKYKGQNTSLTMMITLDHSLWYYDHDFDCRDWVLFVMDTPRVRLGRGVVYGIFYDEAGKVLATASQEGVGRRAPNKPALPDKSGAEGSEREREKNPHKL